MDTFAEQLVTKSQNSSDSMKKIVVLAGGGIIVALFLYLTYVFPLTFILAVGAVYAVYLILTGLNVEYEYTVTNGILDIDKIIAKRKRINMISVEVKEFTAFGDYSKAGDDSSDTTIIAEGGDEESYYADFSNGEHGNVRLIFSPDKKILECIKPFLSRNLKK